jgi:cysteinyl-tRNA synthetase
LKLNLKDKINKLKNKKQIEIPDNINKLWEERLIAKNNKDWKTADKIREEINKLWYEIIDIEKGFKITKSQIIISK